VHENEAVGCRFRGDAGRMGACCNIFPRAVIEELLASARSHDWQGKPSPNKEQVRWKKKAADTWFGRCFMKMGYRAYSYTPSPSQHFATTSAVGHGDNTGKRSSSKFVGTEVSMFDKYNDGNNYPKIRFDLPSGRRKYQEITKRNQKMIRVGIPAVDSFDLTSTAIEHIAANDWPVVIDYVDNGSKDATIPDQVRALCTKLDLPCRITRWEENRQFTPAVNHSLEEADRNNEFFLCLNNDCFVAPNCLERLFLALWSNPEVACVGPFSCDRGHQSLLKPQRLKQSGLDAIPDDPADVAGIEANLLNNTTSSESMLAFFCTLFSPQALHRVGPLPKDKEYESGLAADDVWCRAAIRRKLSNELVHNAYAHHCHSSTFRRLNINRRALQKIALDKYKGRR
jgi:GT2 family glycosyltransferase